jgi:predicted metal-dependent enzyme (double-stranded beta helix superfamily)
MLRAALGFHRGDDSRALEPAGGLLLDRDELVARCITASEQAEPRLATKEVLERAVRELPGEVEKPAAGWLDIWHLSPTLTVLNAVWPPGMTLYPHDHRMWAAIGIYGGQEDNTFYRRRERGLVPSGGRDLRRQDVVLLGDDTIHSVHNPLRRYTGAIHVYGGDFVNSSRSQWDAETLLEEPYDLAAVRAQFDAAEMAYEASRTR